jgi:hypothetical protein
LLQKLLGKNVHASAAVSVEGAAPDKVSPSIDVTTISKHKSPSEHKVGETITL